MTRPIATHIAASVVLTTFSFVHAEPAARSQHDIAGTPQLRAFAPQGRVHRLFGRFDETGSTPDETVQRFLANRASLLSVEPDSLQPSSVVHLRNGSLVVHRLQQSHQGFPVHGAFCNLLVRPDLQNRLVGVTSTCVDLSRFTPAQPAIDAADAIAAVQAHDATLDTVSKPELVIYTGGEAPRLAYRLLAAPSRRDDVRWLYFVGAKSGAVLARESRVWFDDVNGNVSGYATPGLLPDRADNAPVAGPLQNLEVHTPELVDWTDANGDWTITGLPPQLVNFLAELRSPFVRLSNLAGPTYELDQNALPPASGVDFVFNTSPTEHVTAQVNAFIHANIVHDFLKDIIPDYPGIDEQLLCRVNYDAACNAYYNGNSLTFYMAEDDPNGCPNTAYSTVVYHEYGHFAIDSAQPTAAPDYHEGIADTIAAFLIDDPCLAIDFYGPGEGCLRSSINEISYPCQGGAHYCGRVVSGAFWETLTNLKAVMGDAAGLAYGRELMLESIITGAGQISPAVEIDVLTLDDDNGDLLDGTPHFEAIHNGFFAHNLHTPLVNFVWPDGLPAFLSPNEATAVAFSVTPNLKTPQPATGMLHFAIGDAPFISVPLEQTAPNEYTVELPATPCGHELNWYVSVETTDGWGVADPAHSPDEVFTHEPYSTVVQMFYDTFETDLGWTVSQTNGPTGPYSGGWQRVDPVGTSAAPEDDASPDGVKCYVTENGLPGESDAAHDVDNLTIQLTSPQFTALPDAVIGYARWFHWGGNGMEDVMKVEVSNNGGGAWTQVEMVQGQSQWVPNAFKVSDFVTPTDAMKVRIIVADDPNNSLTEAAVDDFTTTLIGCEAECVKGDANLDGQIDGEDVSFFAAAMIEAPPPESLEWCAADMNGDGEITDIDLMMFVNALLHP